MALRKVKITHSTAKKGSGGGSHKVKRGLTFVQVAKHGTPKPSGKLGKHPFQI